MPYFKPYIDGAGLHIPNYNDILEDIIAEMKRIFGDDIYLENDSMDYQMLSIFALKQYDTLQAIAQAYNSRSPQTAIGTGLDAVVMINGIKRKSAGHSTCQVQIIGTPYTQIKNGAVKDKAGLTWDLPAEVTIGTDGTLTTVVTCREIGAVTALPGDIDSIETPTFGWVSVTNEVAASPGQPVETDAELRRRQTVSSALPSQTLLEGTIAGIASVDGVTRYKVYENDTNDNTVTERNPLGLPAHSITAVVEGGSDLDVASQIRIRKGVGCYTNGTTEVDVIGEYDVINKIRFYRPTYIPVDVTVDIKPYNGYTTYTVDIIKQNIKDYIDNLSIGDDLAVSLLCYAALSANANMSNPTFSITALKAGKHGEVQAGNDIITAFNEVLQGSLENITVNVGGQ